MRFVTPAWLRHGRRSAEDRCLGWGGGDGAQHAAAETQEQHF